MGVGVNTSPGDLDAAMLIHRPYMTEAGCPYHRGGYDGVMMQYLGIAHAHVLPHQARAMMSRSLNHHYMVW